MLALKQSDRVRMVVDHLKVKLGKTQGEIGQMVGYTNASAFSQVISATKRFPASLTDRFISLDPTLNPDFIIGTSNDMFVPGCGVVSNGPESTQTAAPGDCATRPAKAAKSPGIFVPAELAQMVADLSATVRDQQRTIGTLVDTFIGSNREGE